MADMVAVGRTGAAVDNLLGELGDSGSGQQQSLVMSRICFMLIKIFTTEH